MKTKRIMFVIMALTLLVSIIPLKSVSAANTTVAYWRFENTDGCFSGNINDDTFKVKDLTGNGNDLEVKGIGTTSEKLLKWTDDGYGTVNTSLLFDNQKSYADKSKTDTFVGGGPIPVAKWLQTVSSAPMNNDEFKNGYTIEAVVKLSNKFDFTYNRYSGIFARQGTRASCMGLAPDTDNTDPLTALNIGTNSNDSGVISSSNKGNLQYINTSFDKDGNYSPVKNETSFDIVPDKWYHIALVNDGKATVIYLDGKEIDRQDAENIGIVKGKDGFGWDVGIGRKYNSDIDGLSSMGSDLEGTPRRPFCGKMAAIKVTSGALSTNEFLSATNFDMPSASPSNSAETPTETPTNTATATTETSTTAPTTTSAAATASPAATTSAPSGDNGGNTGLIIGITAGVVIIGGSASFIAFKKKKK